MEQNISVLREAIHAPGAKVFVLSGAGISVAAGLPTYRGQGGLYPSGALIPLTAVRGRAKDVAGLWNVLARISNPIQDGTPTPAHLSLASAPNVTVATQNIDGLHEAASAASGNHSPVLALHGSLRTAVCLNPKYRHRHPAPHLPEPITAAEVPRCTECNSRLRPDVVLFDESLDAALFSAARAAAGAADVVLAVGTSLQVQPAASLVEHALALGALGAWIDRDPEQMLAELDTGPFRGSAEGATFERLLPIAGDCQEIVPALFS